MNIFFRPSSRKRSSTSCTHRKLLRLPRQRYRLRCRHCRRDLPPEIPRAGCCPECYRKDGVKRYDFVKTNVIDVWFAPHRCEDCGMMIHAG